ncbi:indole-3-glycerol phosphate synthase TrpC [Tumebacillus permanentifrigoris]|uniref:Indole-3-glycerol phosphate synthase n=1 Tax=Tumebacillus permanentifrigoris TaxID=378543 RepID=A0A316D4J2_9BACL|nr:indole-3-glycerol phosphate synthase TrpC [Tumebacillus permanentifrigoris]PWK06613.1 indole-3-glycerol phosphate synthase [Tumebacillus permanentifrigoris]
MILDRIVAVKREEVAELAKHFDQQAVLEEIAKLPPTRGFAQALRATTEYVGLIAEVKKASPSKGVIRPDFDPVEIAMTYERAGATCLSVLTDEQFFQGHADYLRNIRANVALPILRKDFIIDEKQIYEARLIGADCILLIAAILSTEQLREFAQLAASLGLDALVEVHDEEELGRALDAGATLLGVNNRDLRDFSMDLGTTGRLAKRVPPGTLLVSESGIVTHDDVRSVKEAGAAAILVGETLMRDPEIAPSVDLLLGRVAR